MDAIIEAKRRSWVAGADDSDFPLQSLPYGVFSRADDERRRIGVAIGERVVDLGALADAGLFDEAAPDARALLGAQRLNPLLAAGRRVWSGVRLRLADLLEAGDTALQGTALAETALLDRGTVSLHLPFEPGDYVDFYSSLAHATHVGRLLRPDGDPLPANWRHLPAGYHGRSATVVVTGTPVVRPQGQHLPAGAAAPRFGPTQRLDFELELGFVTGPGNRHGEPIPAAAAAEVVFGLVLVNDWSARDIQAWEYQPLGPFLGKSFATSISGWVVPLDAVAPHLVRAPAQEPAPLPYLHVDGDWGVDLHLEVELTPTGGAPAVVSRTNARGLYWTIPQQLAHATVNGAVVRPGDLFASGTISAFEPGTQGSLLELTFGGREPLDLGGGVVRTFLEDGDTVTLRGRCGGDGRPRIGFGEVSGTVLPTTSHREVSGTVLPTTPGGRDSGA